MRGRSGNEGGAMDLRALMKLEDRSLAHGGLRPQRSRDNRRLPGSDSRTAATGWVGAM